MIKEQIAKDIKKTLDSLKLKFKENFTVERPNNPKFGDYSTNIALKNAKINKIKPRKMAEKIAKRLSKFKEYKKVDIAGPGFININLSDTIYHRMLEKIFQEKSKFGKSNYGNEKKVILEFVSANPTGPLNIVSARAAAYGDSMYRIFNFVGFNAFREYYMNDAGNQVIILAESIDLRYRELGGEEIDEFPPEAYSGEYVKDLAAKLRATHGKKIAHLSEKDRLEKMKEFALEEIHNMQLESLKRFGVKFDQWMSEKKLRDKGAIEEALSYLTEADCTYEKDGAVWFCSTEFGDEKDRVLMKKDGTITYFVPDIAYHITKYDREFDYIIDVLGPDHHGYVPRLKAAIQALKYDEKKLEVVFLQQINLLDKGETVKMSKRAGKIVSLDDLIDEVGKDAARYFFLNRKPSAHLNFDLELAKKHSNENPVYYCQYAYARIHSLQVKARRKKITLSRFEPKYFKFLDKEADIEIIKKLMEFPELLIKIADSREPHRLANYAHELAGMFHRYYAKYRILGLKTRGISFARLYLATCIKYVIKRSLKLMGISAPKKM